MSADTQIVAWSGVKLSRVVHWPELSFPASTFLSIPERDKETENKPKVIYSDLKETLRTISCFYSQQQ